MKGGSILYRLGAGAGGSKERSDYDRKPAP